MNEDLNKNYRRVQVLLFIVACLGFAIVLCFTRFGLGATGDSVHYLMGTQNLLSGNGFSRTSGGGEIRPITMAPPFYSIVMSAVGLMDKDILGGVRIFQAFLFGASIFLVGLIIFRYSRSIWASLFGAAIMLMTSNLIKHYGWVLTEALYLILLLLAVYCFALYFDTHKRYLVLLSGFLMGLTTITRYVGASLAAAAVVSILIFLRSSWRQKLIDSLVLFAAWAAPVSLWFVRNVAIGGSVANREVSFHPMAVDLIRAYRAEISFWFVPAQLGFPHWLRKIIMIILGLVSPAFFFLLEVRDRLLKKIHREDPFWILPWFLTLHMVFYAAAIYLTLTFTDAVTDFNVVPRYLIPIYVSAVILYTIVFHRLIYQRQAWLIPRVLLTSVGLCLVFLYAQQSLSLLKDPVSQIGYTGFVKQEPDITAKIKAIDRSVSVISNDPEMFYVIANRPAYVLPIKYDFVVGKEREDFQQQIEATINRLDQGGMIVVFTPMFEGEKEVIDLLNVNLIHEDSRTQFYGYPEAIAE
jgi:4-amino-4-deoxy-L-arabinose transferase-like glycosyltransferase